MSAYKHRYSFLDQYLQFSSSNSSNSKHEHVTINNRLFNLNKSGSKFVGIGLNSSFEPCVKIAGNKGISVTLTEVEWTALLDYQGCILNYFYSQEEPANPIEFDSDKRVNFKIFFETMGQDNIRLVKIFKTGYYIYLGCETVSNLWQLLPLINNRLEMLKKLQFKSYFNTFQSTLNRNNGDLLDTIYCVLLSRKDQWNDNDTSMMELVLIYPDLLREKLEA